MFGDNVADGGGLHHNSRILENRSMLMKSSARKSDLIFLTGELNCQESLRRGASLANDRHISWVLPPSCSTTADIG